jgi:ABC-2 type transport system permease protein/oleandomycin transport system permease protein
VQHAGFIWLSPLTFASSAFVPTDGMPGTLRACAENQPVTQIVDAVHGILLDQPVGSAGSPENDTVLLRKYLY